MNQLRKCTAIKALLALLLFCLAGASWAAQVVGAVVQLSGPLLAKRADGAVRVLSLKSEVQSGDMLVTEKNTYAMLKLIDNSEITLKPSTTFKIENFSYDAGNPSADEASFNLVKGGLRSVTGLLGKRNKQKFSMKTPSATIGIRGTTFIAQWQEPEGELATGLYVQVLDGMINVSNSGGNLNFAVGQFGFTPNLTVAPVMIPADPGLHFMPPPVFNSSTPDSAGAPTKPDAAECEVR